MNLRDWWLNVLLILRDGLLILRERVTSIFDWRTARRMTRQLHSLQIERDRLEQLQAMRQQAVDAGASAELFPDPSEAIRCCDAAIAQLIAAQAILQIDGEHRRYRRAVRPSERTLERLTAMRTRADRHG